jgi:predicted Rossmann fold flavoprotein
MMNAEVSSIKFEDKKFLLTIGNGTTAATFDSLLIATGGYPKSNMFDWITQTGHTIESPVPSLFIFNLPDHPITRLMGVSVEHAGIKIVGSKLEQTGPVLITHWGLSGPAVLKLSAVAARQLAVGAWQFAIRINWLGNVKEQELQLKFREFRQSHSSQKILGKNNFGLPARLWEFLARESGVDDTMRWADLPSAIQNKMIQQLCDYSCEVKGKTTFKEEFVTAGGIKLSEIDHQTMMSKIIPNLYFAGEVMDVDAVTGGYNFQHAWTSGWIAAKAIANNK